MCRPSIPNLNEKDKEFWKLVGEVHLYSEVNEGPYLFSFHKNNTSYKFCTLLQYRYL